MKSRKSANRVAVLGAGSWGTTLANHLAGRGLAVRLWAFEAEVVASISRSSGKHGLPPGSPPAPGPRGHAARLPKRSPGPISPCSSPRRTSPGRSCATRGRTCPGHPGGRRVQGDRDGFARDHGRRLRRGSGPARAPARIPFRPEFCPRGRGRPADGGHRRQPRRRDLEAGAGDVQHRDIPRLHHRRRRRRRDRRRPQERDRDRRGDRRRPRPRPQRPLRPDHARPGRDDAPRRRPRGPGLDLRRSGRSRRSGPDLHGGSFAQPVARHGPRGRALAARRSRPRRARSPRACARRRPRSNSPRAPASNCRSRRRSTGCSSTGSPPASPSRS